MTSLIDSSEVNLKDSIDRCKRKGDYAGLFNYLHLLISEKLDKLGLIICHRLRDKLNGETLSDYYSFLKINIDQSLNYKLFSEEIIEKLKIIEANDVGMKRALFPIMVEVYFSLKKARLKLKQAFHFQGINQKFEVNIGDLPEQFYNKFISLAFKSKSIISFGLNLSIIFLFFMMIMTIQLISFPNLLFDIFPGLAFFTFFVIMGLIIFWIGKKSIKNKIS